MTEKKLQRVTAKVMTCLSLADHAKGSLSDYLQREIGEEDWTLRRMEDAAWALAEQAKELRELVRSEREKIEDELCERGRHA